MTESPQPVADRYWAWMVGFPAAFGGFLGWLGGTLWWRALGPGSQCGPDRPSGDSADCLGVALFVWPVALLLGLAVSWAVLAWATNAWAAPTMTFGGSLAAGYLVAAYQDVAGGPAPASPWVTAAAWGVCYGAVGVACLPGLRRGVRVLVAVILLAVPIGYVVAKSAG
jgi:hypothetical protein